MKLKKIALCLVVMMSVVGAVFAGGQKAADGVQKVTLRVGDTWSATHPIAQAIDQVFKPQVESKTGGAVTVEVYHSGVLGNEQALWDGVRNGSIEVVVIGSVMNTEYPQMLISDWPFLYRDLDHAKKVWTGSFATDFIKEFNVKFPETRMLSVGPNSARTFTSNKKLTSVEDFRGQKFRMPSNPIHVGITENLGASPQVIPLNELFNALQTGVVDGQDNGMITVLSEHLNEVQKYLYETNHIIATMEIVINAGVYNGLPADTQKIISDAAKEAAVWAWDAYIKGVDADRAAIQAGGVIVTPLTPDDQQRIIDAIQPTLSTLYAQNSWARALTDKVKAVQ
jgi:tripartite ATP-independent transporter DctP family solute receptor